MRNRRGVRSPDIKESVLYVLNKYCQNKKAMTAGEISLLISYSCGGVSVSWRNVKKILDDLVSEDMVTSKEIPTENEEPSIVYQMNNVSSSVN